MAAGRSSDSLTGLSSGIAPSFSLAIAASSSAIRLQNEIVGDHDPHREAGTDGDGRLDIQGTADDLLAGLVDALGEALLECHGERAIVVAAHAGFRSDAEQGRED